LRDVYDAVAGGPDAARGAAFATFEDGYRVAALIDAVLASHAAGGVWTKVGAPELVGTAR
jgi:hypothetical protein